LPERTPYDDDKTKHEVYNVAYVEGYRSGISGVLRSYCFAPEHETRGFYDGMLEGLQASYRIFGRTSQLEDLKRSVRSSAAIDRIDIGAKKQAVEPGDTPNTHSPSAQGVGGR
jgi:hypothetical protein